MLDFDEEGFVKFATRCKNCIHYIEDELCQECDMNYAEVLICGMFKSKAV